MIVRTRKLSDKKLVELLRFFFKSIPDARVVGAYFGGVVFSAQSSSELKDISAKANEHIIDHFTVRSGSHSDEVWFYRGTACRAEGAPNPQQRYTNFQNNRSPDPFFDELAFWQVPNRNSISGYFNFEQDLALEISRKLTSLQAPLQQAGGQSAEGFGSLLNQNLADLQQLSADLIGRMAKARQADERAFQSRVKKLEQEFEQQKTKIAEEKAELTRIREEMDDREPQHERRKLRRELTEDLSDFLATPPEGGYLKRNATYFLYCGAGIFFLVISLILTLRIELATEVGMATFWANTIKAVVSGIGGAAFVWAGLSGLKVSAEKQRSFNQELQRYSFDMDRASWVVETLLQMNSIESAQVPDVWLESACRSLFENSESGESKPDSLNALAALLDASARANIGSDGFHFELGPKQARKITRQVD